MSTEEGQPAVRLTASEARGIAGELADVIRQRIADYTPVTNGHEAVILAYTLRILDSFQLLAGQLGIDSRPLRDKVEKEVLTALEAGFWVDRGVTGN